MAPQIQEPAASPVIVPRRASSYGGGGSRSKSPFLAPRRVSSYGGGGGRGASAIGDAPAPDDHNPDVAPEHKSTLAGCTANLVTAIVGAGIIGVPYAVRETGLVGGWLLIALSCALSCKSLRLLVETAKHVDAPSYELMCEAAFGRPGWAACNALMLVMSWGPMLSYFMIVKDTLGKMLGYPGEWCLVVSSLVVMLPLCLQRDMADLAKTSRMSVFFNIGLVGIVATYSPTSESLREAGGLSAILSQSTFHPETCFIGLGVMSFAFSAQHSSIIIAGSLENPTRERWAGVAYVTLGFCLVLALVMGSFGYIGFLEGTDGNILNNFPTIQEADSAKDVASARAANFARGCVCGTMFFVYPLESFVARHVIATNLFQGRDAHEGDDHAILDRWDRRAAITISLYLSVLLPALRFNNVGIVLAWTGTVAATVLSYIGPGVLFVGVHGQEFLDLADDAWGGGPGPLGRAAWYLLGMPLWRKIATAGREGLARHHRRRELMTPAGACRLGKYRHRHYMIKDQRQQRLQDGILSDRASEAESERLVYPTKKLVYPTKNAGENTSAELGVIVATADTGKIYGSVAESGGMRCSETEVDDGEEGAQDQKQTAADFAVAILFVLFGAVAFTAGIYSIYTSG